MRLLSSSLRARNAVRLLAIPCCTAMLVTNAAAKTPPPSGGEKSEAAIQAWGVSGSTPQTGSSSHTSGWAFRAKIVVVIDKARQEMTVLIDSVARHSWKVSTGTRSYDTPIGTYTARSMNEIWYSKQWDDAPMPHAIFFTRKGHAIHGTAETQKLGRPASHGCVRLAPESASTLFALVKETGLENTEIVLSGEIPRSEPKAAAQGSQRQQVKPAKKTAKTAPAKRKTGAAPGQKTPPRSAQQQTSSKQQSAKSEAAAEPQSKKRRRFDSRIDPYAFGTPRPLSRRERRRLYRDGQTGVPPPRY